MTVQTLSSSRGRGSAGPEGVWLSDGVGVDKGRERERAGQAGTWQAGNKFSCFHAKSSQPAKHSTAGSFIGDP